ncbi:MAG: hypothetical protein ACN6RJ_12970 [Stenotrophomonas sp.]
MIRWTAGRAFAIACLMLPCMGAAQAQDSDEARSPQRLDALMDALATTPWPISPGQLHALGIVAPFALEKDAGLRIYRSRPMLTADGYTIESVEYRVLHENADDIRALFVTSSGSPCFPLERLGARYALQPLIYPPGHGPLPSEPDRDQHHSLKAGVITSAIRSQRDAPHCVLGLTR